MMPKHSWRQLKDLENAIGISFHYRGWLSDELQAELDNSYQKLVKQYPHRVRQIAQQYQ
ncbi:hypothetical protein [Endozoicomonas atrinae]|uniref:hypothetical protein n=1 Tax=Endozoicomonas atrinae TaxID=1333660 RepID=UPI000AEDD1BA|nr:hypothetical protein [Endozoicomonas atrinae]